jgi:hypothetical protein
VPPSGQRALATGIAVAVGSIALIYPPKEVVPVVSTKVLC